ncbi:hypothetical protein [uncultured Robinsoniella sp.]|uniref:hypothetical protein n=1 Tax=uncultured Robinsoniella sp. TaxID=904190 RepID=UPI00374FBF87
MDKVTLKTDVLVRITSSDTIIGKEYDGYKESGNLRTEEELRQELTDVLLSELGADTVEIVELNLTTEDEREVSQND